MRSLEESNRSRTGIIGVLVVILVIGVGQGFTSVPMLFAQPSYYGLFTDSGGINVGDTVRIAGVDVGSVQTLAIDDDRVRMGFTLNGNRIGTQSRLAIRTDTILGRKILEIQPRGGTPLRPNSTLPISQSATPYEIYDAFSDATTAAGGWDIDIVKRSLDVLAETAGQTHPHLSAALDGVARFSETISKRDQQFKQLLADANKVAGVLGDRSDQINMLLSNARTLLAAMNERGAAIDYLLANVSQVSRQFEGLVSENSSLNHVLEQLRAVSSLLARRKHDLVDVLTTLNRFAASLAEALGSGPYFKVLLVNLLPGQVLQPFIDAAFKKRGIDPQQFWRNAGLPAFQFPDPNGMRQPNGAPPAAPRVLEGTPDHPGPAVPPGSPCSYTPPADGLPTPGNPLPCAALTTGPFGDNAFGSDYGPPVGVLTSTPDPDAAPASPGLPAAAEPGAPAPTVPGRPVPIAEGPPNSRSVPLGPPAAPEPAAVPQIPLQVGPPAPEPAEQLPLNAVAPGSPPFVMPSISATDTEGS